MTVRRLLAHENNQEPDKPVNVPLDEWLDMMEVIRDANMMMVRAIEPMLIKYGRLRQETPRRRR